MGNVLFLTKQYIKLLQTLVFAANKKLPTRPIMYLLRRNVQKRKILTSIITLDKLARNEETGIEKHI
jgi:hypothetical protein